MEAKEYLQQIRTSEMQINDKLDELKKLQSLATKVNVVNEGNRVKSSGSQDKMANTVVSIVELENEIQEDVNRLMALKREVKQTIEKVSEPDLMSILYKRYVLYDSWEKIAVSLNISYRHATRLHGKALYEIQKIINMS